MEKSKSQTGSELKPSSLDETLGIILERRRQASKLRAYTLPPEGSVDFSSNDFLSLSTSSLLKTAFLRELDSLISRADSGLGSGGSRTLDGNSDYAERLEEDICAFHDAPSGLLVNSGFDGNVALFSTLPQPEDVVVIDELVHASVHDGLRLCRATRIVKFAHNDVTSLTSILAELLQSSDFGPGARDGTKRVFIAVESIYSMDGDRAPLCEIVSAVEGALPLGNGHVIVDEAHATGVVGRRGRGLVSELGLTDRVTARLHTFGKALGCSGAIILCSPVVRSYLINYARPTMFTTFMPSPTLAAIRASYSLLIEGYTEKLQNDLESLVAEFFDGLHRLVGKDSIGGDSHLSPPSPNLIRNKLVSPPSVMPQSPILALISTDPRSLASHCQARGFIVRPIMPPTVPNGTARVRVCLHAGNTSAEIQGLLGAIEEWLSVREKENSKPRL